MSGRDYIAWSLLAGGMLAAIGLAVSRMVRYFRWPELLHARQSRRLHARLEAAVARGPSRYFEDAPSIEREIAAHGAAATPTRLRFPIARVALLVFAAMWFGFILADWLARPVLGVDAPVWPRDLNWVWMPVLGLINLAQSLEPTAENRTYSRVIGIAFLIMGVLDGIIVLVGR